MIRRFVIPIVIATAILAACGSPGQVAGQGLKLSHNVGVAGVTLRGLQQFRATTGIRPQIVEIYMAVGTPLKRTAASALVAQQEQPLIQLNPYRISLRSIAAGHLDRYFSALGMALHSLQHSVLLSFAPEANGTWYSWACHRTPAAVYVAAWQHVHRVIARYDKDIIWLWDSNQSFPTACPLLARWPGAAYVDWVGVDGYLRSPGATFANVIAPTITELRAATGKPVLIAETGVPDVPEAASWLGSIFTGAESIPGVVGIVYFNYFDNKHDYRLEHDPPALAVFRRDAKLYQTGKGP
jgi:mannan endo-1,4-beta-mannosidase